MDNLVNRYWHKYGPTIRENTEEAIRIFNEEKKNLLGDDEDDD